MQQLYTIGQFILLCCNLALMFWMFRNYLRRPHEALEARVTAVEARITANEVAVKENRDSLKQGNDRFREQSKINDVIIHSLLALIEFEVQYCLLKNEPMSKGLEKAKDDLNNFLARR